MRLDTWFRTTKSRRLKKLRQSNLWKQASFLDRETLETAVVDEVQLAKEIKLDDLETEWTKKVEEGAFEVDEVESEGEGPVVGDDDGEDNWIDEAIPSEEVDQVLKEHGESWKSLIERLENKATAMS
jgi:hypothetical protein